MKTHVGHMTRVHVSKWNKIYIPLIEIPYSLLYVLLQSFTLFWIYRSLYSDELTFFLTALQIVPTEPLQFIHPCSAFLPALPNNFSDWRCRVLKRFLWSPQTVLNSSYALMIFCYLGQPKSWTRFQTATMKCSSDSVSQRGFTCSILQNNSFKLHKS